MKFHLIFSEGHYLPFLGKGNTVTKAKAPCATPVTPPLVNLQEASIPTQVFPFTLEAEEQDNLSHPSPLPSELHSHS